MARYSLMVTLAVLLTGSTCAAETREFLIVQSFQSGRLVVESTADAVLTLDVGKAPVVYSTDNFVGTSSLDGFVRLWNEERPFEQAAVESVLEVSVAQLGTEVPLALKTLTIQGTQAVYRVSQLDRYPVWHEQAQEPRVAASHREAGQEVAFGPGVLLLRIRSDQLTSLTFGK